MDTTENNKNNVENNKDVVEKTIKSVSNSEENSNPKESISENIKEKFENVEKKITEEVKEVEGVVKDSFEKAEDKLEKVENQFATHIEHTPTKASSDIFNKPIVILVGVLVVILLFNQYMISGIGVGGSSSPMNVQISDISQIKTTSMAVALLFPVDEIKTEEEAINMMISQGTPDYGASMGITFDDPVGGLELLAGNYNTVKNDIKQNYPEVWDRYLNLALKPVGLSCEFCCGVGPIGIKKNGEMSCGCSHNPAIQSLTMLLMKDTNMDDAEVLREAMRWKALWFPRDMVGLALKASGGEIQTELPGMVGGC